MFEPEIDGIEIVQITANGNQVPSILSKKKIDLILMDISMPILDGNETMNLIKREGHDVPVLMLTMHEEMKYIKKSLELGAQGYILKNASKQELTDGITNASQRNNYFHSKIQNQIFDYFRGEKTGSVSKEELSDREIEIIGCIAKGINSKQISEELFISEHTVKTHRRNIMHKLDVKNMAELIRYAVENDII